MNGPNSNRHPLDKYIDEKLEQLNIEFDPSGWQSVQNMMKSHVEIANPNNSSTFSKFISLKSIAIFTVSALILSLLMYQLIGEKPNGNINTNQNKSNPSLDENTIDSSNQYHKKDQKINSVPSTIPTLKNKEILSKFNNQVPLVVDSTQIFDDIEKYVKIDSLQDLILKDSTKFKKKKHIIW
jgi:hypothetical protein